MDAQELIQVNFQLPAGALDSLARLTEQLRLLTASVGRPERAGTRQTLEQGENRSFDPEQFRALRLEAETAAVKEPPTAGQAVEQAPEMEAVTVRMTGGTLEADAVRPEMQNDVYAPEDAGRRVGQEVEDPAQAGPPSVSAPAGAETAVPDMGAGPSAETIRQDADRAMEEIPTVQAESHPVPDPETVQTESRPVPGPEAVQMEPESRIPEAETVREQVKTPDYEPLSVQAGASETAAVPMNAGFALAAGPDLPRSRWTGGAETLRVSGGRPLTAEDISLAFQRDERRYDNGFPLY